MFKGRDIMKIYRAVTVGQFPRKWTEIRTDIDGYMSTTRVKTLDSNKLASYLELRIETGRTHQIRVHLAHSGHPIVGDVLFNGSIGRTDFPKGDHATVFRRNHRNLMEYYDCYSEVARPMWIRSVHADNDSTAQPQGRAGALRPRGVRRVLADGFGLTPEMLDDL